MSVTLEEFIGRLPGRRPGTESSAAARPGPGARRPSETAALVRRGAALVSAHLLETVFLLAGWACIGSGALSGRMDYGWTAAWALALLTTVPLRALSTWLQGVVSLDLGAMLKRRLLEGAMSLDADRTRSRGAAQLLSDTLESEALSDLGASGGVVTVLAVIELCVAPWLFAFGAAPRAQILVLGASALLCAGLVAHAARLRYGWTRQRLDLSNRLIENMAAHRTRLVQQQPRSWHESDDTDLEAYADASVRLDSASARVQSALPRLYVIASFAVLALPFAAGTASLSELAISLGAVLFTASALSRLSLGFTSASAAWVAWRIVAPLLRPVPATRSPQATVGDITPNSGEPILYARELSFAHAGQPQPLLHGCTLRVRPGEQILLQGRSGGGKSTLASILAGSRMPGAGFVLARGLDRGTLGDELWRQRIALAPQYHENHIFAAPLLFNLLLARTFPYLEEDVAEALAVCQELGLGELLDRMPSGIHQFVGDTGWRLSQGERSRIFLARALLQRADVVVLDESLAALDPENLRQCLECVMRRAPTLILIAHP